MHVGLGRDRRRTGSLIEQRHLAEEGTGTEHRAPLASHRRLRPPFRDHEALVAGIACDQDLPRGLDLLDQRAIRASSRLLQIENSRTFPSAPEPFSSGSPRRGGPRDASPCTRKRASPRPSEKGRAFAPAFSCSDLGSLLLDDLDLGDVDLPDRREVGVLDPVDVVDAFSDRRCRRDRSRRPRRRSRCPHRSAAPSQRRGAAPRCTWYLGPGDVLELISHLLTIR